MVQGLDLGFRVKWPLGRAPLRQGAHSTRMMGEECSLKWCRQLPSARRSQTRTLPSAAPVQAQQPRSGAPRAAQGATGASGELIQFLTLGR